MLTARVILSISPLLVLLTASAQVAQAVSETAPASVAQNDLRAVCKVDDAETSGDLGKLNAALNCIKAQKEAQRRESQLKEIQRRVDALKRDIERSLGAISPGNIPPPTAPVSLPQVLLKPNDATVSTDSIQPASQGAGGAVNQPNDTNPQPVSAGQVVRDSAYNTPTACNSTSQASGGDPTGVILVYRDLLVPKEASDDFGYRLGRRFIIYKVSVTNTSSTLQYSIADISVDLKNILTTMGAVPDQSTGKYPRFLGSGHDLSLLRGISEKGQDYDPRNMTLHILQGIGSTAGAVSGLTPFPDVMGPATADFNGAFLQAFVGIAPDHTAAQLNRLSDMAFSPNNLIDKNQTKTYAVFIPESLLLQKNEQKVFWSNPRKLLNIYPFDQVDVCVAGQLLTPAATTASPIFSPNGGNLAPGATISLSAASADAIYYTMNGAIPTVNDTKYTKPFTVSSTIGAATTVQAFASASNQVPSPIVTKVFITQPQAATPTFTPNAGAIKAGTSVVIATTTPGQTIYYTTDGTSPTTASTSYSGPIVLAQSETLRAIAMGPANAVSAVGTAQYTVSP